MLKRARWGIWAVALCGLWIGCSPPRDDPGELLVFAAASLADALGEIEDAFEARNQVQLALSYGGSQMLAQQIASGAPADMLISAGVFPVNFLAEKGLLEAAGTDLLVNKLVMAVRSTDKYQVTSMENLGVPPSQRLAVANPELAPAGRYARESLMHLGLWDKIQPKLVFGADVRATMAYLESGNADAALVYATDARAGRNVEILDIVPPDSYSRITYPVAIVKGGRAVAAKDFLEFLRSAAALEIFRKHGFEPAE